MALSEVSICNSALIKIGAEVITALSDSTKRAELCNARYDFIRDSLLESHPWTFAIKRDDDLTGVATDPTFDYDYEYTLPSDFLRAISLKKGDEDIEFEVSQGLLYSNATDIDLVYISQITDPTEFSNTFAEALAWALAADICYALTQSVSLSERVFKASEAFQQKARTSNAQGRGTPLDTGVDRWTNARL